MPARALTLGLLCADLGPELVEITVAPRGVELPITRVWLHDPLEAVPSHRSGGALLLAVGSSPDDPSLRHFLGQAAAAGVAAIACRGDASWPQVMLETAEEAGVALLRVRTDLTWGELYELANAAILVDTERDGEAAASTGFDLNDLANFAEALAAVAGGSVTIDDMQSRVLAFSGGEAIDQMRTLSILNRRLPERWLSEMRRQGVIERLMTEDDVIHVNFGDSKPRRAIAVRLGKSVLGSIWLAGNEDELSPDADDALRRAAPIAALQLMRNRVAGDVERRMRESSLAALLTGGEVSPGALADLGLGAEDRFVVLALEVTTRGASSPAALPPRLIDLLTMHLRSYERPALATTLAEAAGYASGERIYAVTSSRGASDRASLGRIAKEALGHAEKMLEIGLRVGIGEEVDGPADLITGRRSAEDCLALAPASERVAFFEEIEDQALLREVARFVADRRAEPSATLRDLVEHDEAHGTEYVHTLRCLFDAFGNAAQVASRLGLHPNTVRYRIKRIIETAGVDLGDGDARLALELTLRAESQRGQ